MIGCPKPEFAACKAKTVCRVLRRRCNCLRRNHFVPGNPSETPSGDHSRIRNKYQRFTTINSLHGVRSVRYHVDPYGLAKLICAWFQICFGAAWPLKEAPEEGVVDMTKIEVDIPESLKAALEKVVAESNHDLSYVVTAALSRHLGMPIHTLFQVSTSGALVAGVFEREVTVRMILDHGDFGLGTFADLDGEMVVLDGRAYRVKGTGEVIEAAPDAGAPFAVVTNFSPGVDTHSDPAASFSDLVTSCDKQRNSSNVFYAFRLDGCFTRVHARAVNPPPAHARLVDAAEAQSEFFFHGLAGTLVGLWSPGFSSAFSVPGYHFHFLSQDRKHGGHVLDVAAGPLRLRVEALTEFRLALPESEAFLKADLSKNTSDELAYAEHSH
jgi:acetolactate decarboxylase